MAKGYIIVSIPENCGECKFRNIYNAPHCVGCAITRMTHEGYDKPGWCPIRPDIISDSLRELIEEYGEDGMFSVGNKEISAKDLIKELEIDSEIGTEFRNDITKTIISYFMKFGGEA